MNPSVESGESFYYRDVCVNSLPIPLPPEGGGGEAGVLGSELHFTSPL